MGHRGENEVTTPRSFCKMTPNKPLQPLHLVFLLCKLFINRFVVGAEVVQRLQRLTQKPAPRHGQAAPPKQMKCNGTRERTNRPNAEPMGWTPKAFAGADQTGSRPEMQRCRGSPDTAVQRSAHHITEWGQPPRSPEWHQTIA